MNRRLVNNSRGVLFRLQLQCSYDYTRCELALLDFSVTIFVNGECLSHALGGKEDTEVKICLFQAFCF